MAARLASVLLVALASTAAAQTRTIPVDTVIRLQRTSCLGTCPAYTVTIDATGGITYEGDRYVRVVGGETSRIGPAAIARLLQVADRVQFFALRDAYDGDITDLPTTYVSITTGGRTKRIKDYYGAPSGLKELEDAIDAAARTKRWIFVEDDTLDALVGSGWSAASVEGVGLLLEAVGRDDVAMARRLLEVGAQVTEWSRAPIRKTPPLYLARSAAMVELLVAAGADPNERLNHSSLTALMVAASFKEPGALQALVKAGARLEEVADGHTALYQAACAGRLRVVTVLLAAGASPRGSTDIPAVECARRSYAEEMERRRRVPSIVDGRTALDDFRAVIALLEQADPRR
jgi:hypothetical protein